MRLEKVEKKRLKKMILKIVGKYLDLSDYKIFFFGSRVAGGGSPTSDIDIGIEGKRAVPGAVMAEIRDDIEDLNILYKIDFVDFKLVSPQFKKIALKKIEKIN